MRRLSTWGGVMVLSGSVLAGCGDEAKVSAQGAPAANPDQVVAEVGGKPITLKEVDAKWEEFDAAEHQRVMPRRERNCRTRSPTATSKGFLLSTRGGSVTTRSALCVSSESRVFPEIGIIVLDTMFLRI